MSKIRFMNTYINNLTMNETLLSIDSLIKQQKKSYVVTPNVDHIIKLEKDKKLEVIYKNADLILTDGKPLIWISKFYRTPIAEKISGSDLFPQLCQMCAQKGYKMFFLGAAEGVAKKASENLAEKYSDLNIVGTYSPPFGFEKDSSEVDKIIQIINEAEPHVLIVGLGCPKQEYFIYDYHNKLKAAISLGLGASLDFEAGNIKRAPRWMSSCGLEWFYRLCREPRRMFKRYLVQDIKIIKLIFKYKPTKKQTSVN